MVSMVEYLSIGVGIVGIVDIATSYMAEGRSAASD
jgi:hypothetical protein